mmetsp:Transcript_65497/g.211198  ORF Transcript_65497/g.211198 Transcript_65497/m.211198 type:complete len:294 (+) Transcript_65497:217-1098(+)
MRVACQPPAGILPVGPILLQEALHPSLVHEPRGGARPRIALPGGLVDCAPLGVHPLPKALVESERPLQAATHVQLCRLGDWLAGQTVAVQKPAQLLGPPAVVEKDLQVCGRGKRARAHKVEELVSVGPVLRGHGGHLRAVPKGDDAGCDPDGGTARPLGYHLACAAHAIFLIWALESEVFDESIGPDPFAAVLPLINDNSTGFDVAHLSCVYLEATQRMGDKKDVRCGQVGRRVGLPHVRSPACLDCTQPGIRHRRLRASSYVWRHDEQRWIHGVWWPPMPARTVAVAGVVGL